MMRRHSRAAFSLIETILSISVGMMLMVAATTYLFGLTQAYVRLEEDPLFDDHVEGVCSLLESFVGTTRQSPVTRAAEEEKAEVEAPKPKANSNTRRKGKGDLRWEAPPGGGAGKDYVLAFSPQVASFFFSGLPGPLPTFDGYLAFVPKEGLFLIYQTPTQKKESASRVSVTLLSPWVNALDYAFYDDKLDSWTFHETAPPGASDDKPKLPTAVRLTFEEDGHESTRYIYLPNSSD